MTGVMISRNHATIRPAAGIMATPIRLLLAAVLLLAALASPQTVHARWKAKQQAKGAVNAGHLERASRLHNTRYVKLRFPANAWGTRRMVDLVQQCAKEVRRRHRSAHRLLVGDLSRRTGGPMPPHAGHQNGREADVGFYMRSGRALGGLWRVGGHDLDARRTLTFLACAIDSHAISQIFLDRALQAPLVREARRVGWKQARIDKTFSWPRGRNARVGIIQHRGGHDNHLHLRLHCAAHERHCRDKPVARRHALRAKRKPSRHRRRRRR